MYSSILSDVLEKYGIKYQQIFDHQKGYRNEIWPVLTTDNQMINVTFYKRESGIVDRIKRADTATEYLATAGMPTRRRFDERILTLKNNNSVTYVGVYEYLLGDTIPWEAYTMEHIKTLGGTMSDMHSLLSGMHVADFPSVYEEYLMIIDRMKTYFLDIKVRDAISNKLGLVIDIKKLDKYAELLNQYTMLPGQQVLHMDFVRGNILFQDAQITGILDFEKTAVGHTVVDIARTLAFLLVDCKYKKPDKIIKYFLYSGYLKRGQNKDIGDKATRAQLMEMFLVYDFYKFLKHNPYESLKLNEHYNRTKDILVKRGVVLYIQ